MSLEPEIKEKIEFEYNQILNELKILKLLKNKLQIMELDEIDIRAVATVLHSVYNGIEKILILIIKYKRIELPKNRDWHTQLLKMAQINNYITTELKEDLEKLMGFRHFFRHAYSFMIDIELLKPLINETDQIVKSFIESIYKIE